MTQRYPKFDDIIGVEPDTRPLLEPREAIIQEGLAERVRFLSQSRGGFLILTNRRLLWHERAIMTMKWRIRELRLAEVVVVDRGSLIGGRRLRLRLADGTVYCFQGGIDDVLDDWIAKVRWTVADARQRGSRA